uniref:Solute carrier family 25 member 48 n=1 Tax=Salmo trutta TaxID=8032 RepID=A0A673VZU2_SALTR
NTLHCVLQIYRKETFAGFFKGLSFPLASITVYNSVVKLRHGDERRAGGMLDMTLASMLTGLMSVGLGAPSDLVKIRLQMQILPCLAENLNLAGTTGNGNGNIAVRSMTLQGHPTYRGPIHCISSILQTEGIRGLYRGAGAMVLRDVPGYTLYFIPYALFRRWLSSEGRSSPHPCSIWVSGGLAGSISWVTATPADVVKSRLQADSLHTRKYRGIVHCIVQSYKTEGIHVINAIRGFPMSATMFLGYELSLQFFRGF